MASIRKRNSRWQVQVRREGHQPISKSFLQKSDALAWARKVESEQDRSHLPYDPQKLNDTTFADLLKRFRTEVSPTRKSGGFESKVLSIVERAEIGSVKLSKLTPAVIAKFRDERLARNYPAYVLRILGLLQSILETARRDWGIGLPINPVKAIKKPTGCKPRDRRLNPGELETLLTATKKAPSYLSPIISFAVATGMRRGELLNLRWGDINFERRTLHIPITKNGHPRTIPLSPEALAILNSLKPGDRSDGSDKEVQIFPITPNALRLSWERLRDRAGVADLHFHDLRHEAISRFFERGLSVPEVALISGHRDFRMLARYTHLRAEEIAKKLA